MTSATTIDDLLDLLSLSEVHQIVSRVDDRRHAALFIPIIRFDPTLGATRDTDAAELTTADVEVSMWSKTPVRGDWYCEPQCKWNDLSADDMKDLLAAQWEVTHPIHPLEGLAKAAK